MSYILSLLIPHAHAAADASMASTTEGIATAVKENFIAGVSSSTVLTALAIVVALVVLINFAMRIFKRAGR